MFHSLDRKFLYTAYRIKVTFREYQRDRPAFGTCFFVRSETKPNIMVTNRHVLDAGFSDFRRSHWELSEVVVSGFAPRDFQPIEFELAWEEIRFPSSDLEDVAVLVRPEIKRIIRAPSAPIQSPIMEVPIAMVAEDSDFEDVLLADELLYPGYPEWHDQSEGRPIMRRGALASDPYCNYLGPEMTVGGRILAYEAFSFGGSSGSPVFLPPFGVRLNDEHSGNYRPTKLLGINSGHLLTRDGMRHHSGISYFYRSSILHEILEGIERH
jgi:hypothetical protein